MRSGLWKQEVQVERTVMPTIAQMISDQIGRDRPLQTHQEVAKPIRGTILRRTGLTAFPVRVAFFEKAFGPSIISSLLRRTVTLSYSASIASLMMRAPSRGGQRQDLCGSIPVSIFDLGCEPLCRVCASPSATNCVTKPSSLPQPNVPSSQDHPHRLLRWHAAGGEGRGEGRQTDARLGQRKRAFSAAIMTSHASASSNPPPMATPFTAAIIGELRSKRSVMPPKPYWPIHVPPSA